LFFKPLASFSDWRGLKNRGSKSMLQT
jgi:hypothetical protein